jgi:hypothetical protein
MRACGHARVKGARQRNHARKRARTLGAPAEQGMLRLQARRRKTRAGGRQGLSKEKEHEQRSDTRLLVSCTADTNRRGTQPPTAAASPACRATNTPQTRAAAGCALRCTRPERMEEACGRATRRNATFCHDCPTTAQSAARGPGFWRAALTPRARSASTRAGASFPARQSSRACASQAPPSARAGTATLPPFACLNATSAS